MFAINHAATALIIKQRYPKVPLMWLLLSVQFVEILWVLFNYLGIERTSTEAVVNTVSEIHLEYMPYSHSIASSLLFAWIAWFIIGKLYKQRDAAVAIAIGILSHIVLDVLTHTRDISIIPFLLDQKVGIGLYAMPLAAFFVETAYGLFCWWIFRGGKALLVTILVFNLSNISFFSEALRGPEVLMANHPMWIVTAVALQIVITLVLVWLFARPAPAATGATVT
ncbi:MAG: hypothetical protein HY066_05175 [Betaproteobacteria bacterium]|nr:hypothetical protein [Betaproteobacteria bacterium]